MGQYVYEQLIPNKKGDEVDVPFSSFLVPDPLIIETTSIYSLKKITNSIYAIPYISNVNDDYFRIRTDGITESENVEYFRIVYTSMPKEGGYYYSDVGLYEKGILVLLKGNLNDTTALTSLYNGDVHIKPVSLGQGYYYYDIPNDYKVMSSAGISINSTSDITTILYFTPGGGDPRSLKFSKDSESYFVDLTDLVKEAKDYLVTVTIE